jgi:hypothetical protein
MLEGAMDTSALQMRDAAVRGALCRQMCGGVLLRPMRKEMALFMCVHD